MLTKDDLTAIAELIKASEGRLSKQIHALHEELVEEVKSLSEQMTAVMNGHQDHKERIEQIEDHLGLTSSKH